MRIKRYMPLLIVVAGSLVFWQVIGFEFVRYDDPIHISKNPRMLSPAWDSLFYFWRHLFLNLYIPVTYTAWLGLAALSDNLFNRLDPGLFHLANGLVHLVNCLLVYRLIRRLYDIRRDSGHDPEGFWPALLAGLVFCLHPVQAESVCWVSGFKGVFCCLWSLCAM